MGDTAELSQRILRLFEIDDNSIGQPRKHNSCAVCGAQNIPDGVDLSEETVKVLLKALLGEIGDKNGTEYSSTWVCVMCSCSLGSLVELVNQLEILRHEFNLLRKQVGMKVIVGSLGESTKAFEAWAKDIESVEDVFPCGAVKRLLRTSEDAGSSFEVNEDFVKSEDEDEMFAEEPLEFCEYFNAPSVEQNEDIKLTQMRAAVILRRLDCGTLGFQPSVAVESTGNYELIRECSLKELPRGATDCLEKSSADLPSPRKEVRGNFPDLKKEMVEIAEQLLKNFRPKRSLLARQFLDPTNDQDKDNNYCANDIKSCSPSAESEKVLVEDEAGMLECVDKGGLNVSFEKVILCGYCALTFPTKTSWREHRIRNHSKEFVASDNLSAGGVNQTEGVLINKRNLTLLACEEVKELSRNCAESFEISKQLGVTGSLNILSRYKETGTFTTKMTGTSKSIVSQPLAVHPVDDFIRENPRMSAHEVIDNLPSEGICCQDNAPLVSSISRVLQTEAAGNVTVIRNEDREDIECNEKQTGYCNEIPRNSGTTEFLNLSSEEQPMNNKKPRRSYRSRRLEIADFEDFDAEDDFGEIGSDNTRKEYSCGYCELTCSTKLSLLEHWKHLHSLDSTNPKTPKCVYCLRVFLKKRSLLTHLDRVHYGIPVTAESKRRKLIIRTSGTGSKESDHAARIHCFICDNLQTECFSNLAELEAHALTETHLKNIKLKFNVHCNVCRVGFGGNADALQQHLKSQIHLVELEKLGKFNKETFCSACRMDCGSPKDLRLHRSSVGHWKTCKAFMGSRVPVNILHNQNLKCPECPRTFTNRRGVQVHVKKCHKPGLNVCEFCEKVFLDSRDCKSHRKIHNVPKPFSCTECSHTFEKKEQLERHKYTYHSRTSLICPTCGIMFKSRTSLHKHEKAHLLGEETGYKCSYTECSKKFSFPNKLRRHKYIEHKDDVLNETPYVCLVCFKGFKTTNELKVHMDAHDDLKCYFCGKYFQMICNLENHLRVHFGEKPYSCTYCNKRFGARQNMNGHIKRHKAMDKKQMKVTSPDK